MPARKCLSCGRSFPATKGSGVKCPVCPDEPILQYSSHAKPDTDYPPEIPEVLPDLTEQEREEFDADWNELRAEAARRGPRWSVADLLAEGWSKAA